MTPQEERIRKAYLCYTVMTTVAIAACLFYYLPMNAYTQQTIGLTFGVPATLALLAFGLLALTLSLLSWRHQHLRTMFLATLSLLELFILNEQSDFVPPAILSFWLAWVLSLLTYYSVRWWFSLLRQRCPASR